jgi:hypothetical protein
MLKLPAVPKMTMQAADDFLHTHFADLAGDIEDYEFRGGTHFYFASDDYVVKINKHKAMLIHEERKQFTTLAEFTA